MRLLPAKRTRARIEVGDLPGSPRDAAIHWLHTKTELGQAGLDPFDPSVFVLIASENERKWAYRSLQLAGQVLSYRDVDGGGQRLRAILEADVRVVLELDKQQAFLDDAPPLESLSVDAMLETNVRHTLHLVDPEPESLAALRRAKQAYDSRPERVH